MCCVQVERRGDFWVEKVVLEGGSVGRRGGHLLTIYKKGAYKNLQGDSSVFPKNPELRPLG